MKTGLVFLNKLLETYPPDSIIRLSTTDARRLAELSRFNLGDLSDLIGSLGASAALEQHGLFGRHVSILRDFDQRSL